MGQLKKIDGVSMLKALVMYMPSCMNKQTQTRASYLRSRKLLNGVFTGAQTDDPRCFQSFLRLKTGHIKESRMRTLFYHLGNPAS